MHIMDVKLLGKLLTNRRRELGLTQQAVASLAKVGRRTLIELEAGEADIGLRRLLRILMVLSLDLELRLITERPSEDQLRDIFRDEDE